MSEYVDIINSMDVLNIVENRITLQELKENKLQEFYRYCNNDGEKIEALQYVEDAFAFIVPFLSKITVEEYETILKYGRKNGTNSYEINYALRNKLPLGDINHDTVCLLDSAISKFTLEEEITVYRALKPSDLVLNIGEKFSDEGYMSTSLSIESSYAYFKDYDIILEITLPINSKCLYIEWFKGSNDEKELLLGRGTKILIQNVRKEIVNGNEKIVYSCVALQNDLDINNRVY